MDEAPSGESFRKCCLPPLFPKVMAYSHSRSMTGTSILVRAGPKVLFWSSVTADDLTCKQPILTLSYNPETVLKGVLISHQLHIV